MYACRGGLLTDLIAMLIIAFVSTILSLVIFVWLTFWCCYDLIKVILCDCQVFRKVGHYVK